ncbi:hypothetical protein ABIE26_004557 [Pedobacter africanus]|uniref:Uncharacterized protein n=1 Tax=Pedobacter africanus TaxID=151894 RepID=A0ACC6L3A7_9SPHI|nr:hypothetical protein [Pedobacter africanus]MDR6785974.1 hypothetical protein [Pedobacter africanus]
MSIIKVGFLVSYDYEFLRTSLPLVYDYVPEIFFAVDVERKTWAGKQFSISEGFWEWVKEIDTQNKITIYEDKFFIPELTAIECDTRERNLLGKQMGVADWYVQIDSDEYFVDFEGFVNKLKQYKPSMPTTVTCRVVTMFKKLESGYLLIDESMVSLNFATNNPVYDVARVNQSGNTIVDWDDLVLHQSWARSSTEILLKLKNWGHKDDFNTISFYNLWEAIDEYNYVYIRDFHPLQPIIWGSLFLEEGNIIAIRESLKLRIVRTRRESDPVKRKPFLSRLWRRIKFW